MSPYNQQAQAIYNPYDAYNVESSDHNEPRFPDYGGATIRVQKVIFVPTGTYDQQYRRPWVADYNVENANSVHEVVAAAYHRHQIAKANGQIHAEAKYMVDPMDLAGVSASFIKPAAQVETYATANLKHGWKEHTGRFMMNLLVQRNQAVTPTRYLVIGYTNYLGFSENFVSPDMELNINVIFEVRDVEVDRGFGRQIESQLVQVNQVLTDHEYNDPNTAKTIRLRPYEVAASLARHADPVLQNNGVTVADTRVMQNGTAEFSNHHHTNPNNYMANILTGLVNGRDMSRLTGKNSPVDPYHRAAQQLRDASVRQDPFMKAISTAVGNGTYESAFKWRDLLRIDPNADRDEVCHVQWRNPAEFRGSVGENMHTAGTTTEWTARTLGAQAASAISNMLPSMMVDLGGIRRVEIFASNHTGQSVIFATNAVSIMDNVNLAAQLEVLKNMVHHQIVMPLTYNGSIYYNLRIVADMFGETVIHIKLDAEVEQIYVQPTYCSSATSPVITTQVSTLDNLSQAFHNLQQSALPAAAPMQPLIHDYGHMPTAVTGKRY